MVTSNLNQIDSEMARRLGITPIEARRNRKMLMRLILEGAKSDPVGVMQAITHACAVEADDLESEATAEGKGKGK